MVGSALGPSTEDWRQASLLARRLFLFALPLLVVLAGFDRAVAGLPTTLSAKASAFDRAAPTVETLILGSSHAALGLDPNAFSRPAFNLANVSQPLALDARLADWALARAPRTRTVVLAVSYFSFRFALEDTPEAWRLPFYAAAFGFDDLVPWWAPARFSAIARYGDPLTALQLVQTGRLRGRWGVDPVDARGMQRHTDGHGARDDAAAAQRASQLDALMHAEHTAPNRAVVTALLQRLAARHVRVALVTTPVNDAMRRHYRPEVLAEMRAIVAQLARQPGVRAFDHLADPAFGSAHFHDCDHLNDDGAAVFAHIVDRELQNWK